MKTIKASEFKTKWLGFIDEVAEKREPIIITKSGKLVSRLVPFRQKLTSFFGLPQGTIRSHDDPTGPLDEP